MKTLWLVCWLCAMLLPGTAALGAGFEGLRSDPDAPKGQSGEIDALDPERRTFRIGGNTFETPEGVSVDFEALRVGDKAVVHYRESGGHNVVTRFELKK